MENFYYVRHGQTDANLRGMMCGANWDIELNETGIGQAKAAATRLQLHIDKLEIICVSPLLRARKTAEIIAEKFAAPIVVVDELKEWDIGGWDRMPFAQVKDQFLGTGEPLGGETRAQFRTRVALAIKKSAQHSGPALLVSHGAVWLTLQEILGLPPMRVENGVPYRVHQEKDSWQATQLGEV